MRVLKTLCGAAALVALMAAGAQADEWNKLTYLTFSGPVQIPGATLPAGTYSFEVANPDTTRHVIRVSEKDTRKPVGLFMTIPMERMDPPQDNLIMFAERPAGSPQAIQAWFYPGDRSGEEFVYPKNQAMQIAKANHRPVLATEGGGVAGNGLQSSESDRMAAMRGAHVGRVDENGNPVNDDSKTATSTTGTTAQSTQSTTAGTTGTTAAPANTATGRRATGTPGTTTGTTARAETTPRSTTAARSQTATGTTANQNARRRTELPRTASNLVALELLSALSLAGGFTVRRVRQAIAK